MTSRLNLIILLLINLVFAGIAQAVPDKDNGTLNYDNQKYIWEDVERIVAVGDLHGDFEATVNILTHAGVMDKEGNWIGGKTHLVQTGDIFDGAPYSKMIMTLMRHLQVQAEKAGGRVHVLYGNHEVLAASGEAEATTDENLIEGSPIYLGITEVVDQKVRDRIRKQGSSDAAWLAGLNTAILIRLKGQQKANLFVHAGFEPEDFDLKDPKFLGRINATARSWMRYFLGFDQKRPPKSTGWVVGLKANGKKFARDIGPIFTRILKIERKNSNGSWETKPGESAPDKKTMKLFLDALNVVRMIVGHAPTPGSQIANHPVYGKQVIIIDTHNSKAFQDTNGNSYVTIQNVESLNPQKEGKWVDMIFPVSTPRQALNISTWKTRLKDIHGRLKSQGPALRCELVFGK